MLGSRRRWRFYLSIMWRAIMKAFHPSRVQLAADHHWATPNSLATPAKGREMIAQLGYPERAVDSAWYAGTSIFGMIVVIVLAGYAFYISLGGQKVFKRNLLED